MREDDLRESTSDKFEDDLIEALDDGFERLGSIESPFTLRVPPTGSEPQKFKEAQRLHQERQPVALRADELRVDPITRNLDQWVQNMSSYDFPGVDTVPRVIRRKRAEAALEVARSVFSLSEFTRDVSFEDPAVRGRYWTEPTTIEIGTDTADFPGWRFAATLAHEIGHHADNHIKLHRHFYSETEIGDECLFETQTQYNEARTLSVRIRGEITDRETPGVKNYRKKNSEYAADAFAAMVLEPDRTRQQTPAIASRLEDVFSEFFTEFQKRRHRIDSAWMRVPV